MFLKIQLSLHLHKAKTIVIQKLDNSLQSQNNIIYKVIPRISNRTLNWLRMGAYPRVGTYLRGRLYKYFDFTSNLQVWSTQIIVNISIDMHFYRTKNNDVKIDNYSQKAYFFNLIIIYGCSAAYPQENLIFHDCYYPHEK